MPENTAALVSNYGAIVHASYADSLSLAEDLSASVDAFLAAPSADTLEGARDAWLAAREPYLQTEVYRFYDGPIDHPEDGPEGLINAWPLDEAYIHYVEDVPDAGIVNDAEVAINADNLMSLNEQGGTANIATGYHAVEFLLWGQDLRTNGAGERPHSDYLEGEGGRDNADRRGAYLATVSDLLVEHLTGLVAAWAPDAANYRADMVAADPEEGLRRILTGMIVLSGFETGGERLQTALDSGDQEDEHSCFSDNTHRDMVQDVRGVQNVWLGRYTRLDGSVVSGTGVRDVVAAVDSALAAELDSRIAQSLTLAEALVPPFDQEIAPGNEAGRARVQALAISLREQEELLQEVFQRFGLDVPVVE